MKAWLKGGLIGLCIGIISFFLYFIGLFGGRTTCPGAEECLTTFRLGFLMYPSQLGYLPFLLLINTSSGDQAYAWLFILPFLTIISYFILGIIIGWIIGKIKSSK